MLSLTPPRHPHGGVSSFSPRIKVKRIAYSLILFGLLWSVTMAALPERLWEKHWSSEDGVQSAVRITAVVIVFILFPIAGWILAGISNPKEGPGHRLIMAFAMGFAGAVACAMLIIVTLALKSSLDPSPPPPDLNDR